MPICTKVCQKGTKSTDIYNEQWQSSLFIPTFWHVSFAIKGQFKYRYGDVESKLKQTTLKLEQQLEKERKMKEKVNKAKKGQEELLRKKEEERRSEEAHLREGRQRIAITLQLAAPSYDSNGSNMF
nr:hypothetical protein [Tanacetum cinerariifolium]